MEAYRAEPGPHRVSSRLFDWYDSDRRREVPVRVYLPEGGQDCPLVVFSPGLGSSRDGYGYLGRHWASWGYVSIHVTHRGTDAEALRVDEGRLPKSIADFLGEVEHRIDRPRDLSFVLDQAAREPKLAGCVDLTRVAAAGHSFGAYTALALVGLTLRLPGLGEACFADTRILAAVAMSPPSSGKYGLHAGSWSRIQRPVLSITGTRDIEYGEGTAERRRETFDRVASPGQYLLTIEGASHAAFNDQQDVRIPIKPRDPEHQRYVCMTTMAFLDAYLRGASEARTWLAGEALGRVSNGKALFERKL